MTREERQYVKETIDDDGFDYALRHYSDYEDIEDEKFHMLLDTYRKAAEAIEDYVG